MGLKALEYLTTNAMMILSVYKTGFQRVVGWCETTDVVKAVSYRSRTSEHWSKRLRVGPVIDQEYVSTLSGFLSNTGGTVDFF